MGKKKSPSSSLKRVSAPRKETNMQSSDDSDSDGDLEEFTKKFMSTTHGTKADDLNDSSESEAGENVDDSDEESDEQDSDGENQAQTSDLMSHRLPSGDDSDASEEDDDDDDLSDDGGVYEHNEGEAESSGRLVSDSEGSHTSDDQELNQSDSEVQNTEDKEEKCQKEYNNFRAVVADMSFQEVQELKEKVGTKMFNLAMSRGAQQGPSKKRVFVRENKNRPLEKTSKRTVSRYKPAFDVKKKTTRDPRFDDLSGEFNETYFKQAYSFLDGVKQREKQKLLTKLKKESDPEKKKKLQLLISRIVRQENEERKKEDVARKEKVWRNKQNESIKEGKKPYFLKKSTKKSLELADRYNELKKSGKVENYMAKKRKKNAGKERKKLPFRTT